jgi:site-specific DNA-methyltransferase (adenine-specific)/modification methylase
MKMAPVIIGKAALYLGSCEDILPHLPRVDAVVTDPPYGIGKDTGAAVGGYDGSGKYLRRPKQYEGGWDGERPSAQAFAAILASGRSAIIWGGNYFADLLPQGGRWLFWDKLNAMPSYSDGEIAWTNIAGVSVKKFTRCNNGLASIRDGERIHPTQKPCDLMRWCLGFLPDAQTILDPFAGSGTTGVAAIQMGKSFIGIEREPKYFEAMCRRIREANGDDAGPLFQEANCA